MNRLSKSLLELELERFGKKNNLQKIKMGISNIESIWEVKFSDPLLKVNF
jgi:hypothetical protein